MEHCCEASWAELKAPGDARDEGHNDHRQARGTPGPWSETKIPNGFEGADFPIKFYK